MKIGIVSNPKKSIVVDFSMTAVETTFNKLVEGLNVNDKHLVKTVFKVESYNEVLKQLTLSASELLSLGVTIDINLNFISDTKTSITVEVKRKFGAFDESAEVQLANDHITNVFNTISELLLNTDINYDVVKAINKEKQAESTNKQWKIIGYILLVCAALVFFAKAC